MIQIKSIDMILRLNTTGFLLCLKHNKLYFICCHSSHIWIQFEMITFIIYIIRPNADIILSARAVTNAESWKFCWKNWHCHLKYFLSLHKPTKQKPWVYFLLKNYYEHKKYNNIFETSDKSCNWYNSWLHTWICWGST